MTADMGGRRIVKTVLFFALLLSAGCQLQKNMLYYPDHQPPSGRQLADHQLQFWPSGPENYRGFVSTSPASPEKGTVVVFHGNAGSAADRAYYVKALAPLGHRVILAEYPGYGARSGDPGESVFVADAVATLRLARDRFGGPLYVLGESLGCGVAAAAVRTASLPVDGLVLITPWDTLLSVAQEKFPWLPVRVFLSDHYDSIENLKGYTGRIAVVGAARDEVIPVSHAEALYRTLAGPKRMWTITGAGHNDWPLLVDLSWWREISDFISSGDGQEGALPRT